MTDTRGRETRDVDFRRVTLLGVGLVAVLILFVLLMWVMFRYLAARETGRQEPPASLAARSKDSLPPEPRLEEDPLRGLLQLRAEEEAILGGYGWVDRGEGAVRIPVERAMEILVERGMPARPASPAGKVR